MIVHNQTPPSDGLKAIGNALADLAGHRAPQGAALAGSRVNISAPLPIYRLELADIKDESSVNLAKRAGWRYLIEPQNSQKVAYADLIEAPNGDAVFVSYSRNRNAENLLKALHIADDIAAKLPEVYEARLLDVPALYLAAVWLQAGDSIFIPYIDGQRFADPAATVHVQDDFPSKLLARAQAASKHFSGPGSATAP